MHDCVNELFLTAFRIFLKETEDLDSIELRRLGLESGQHLADMGDGLRLVVLDGNGSLVHSENLLDDSCSDDHLLPFLKKGAEVGCEIRLTLAAIDNQHLAFLARRRGKFHVGRECGSAKSDDAAELDLVHYHLVVICKIGDEGICSVDSLCPLVAFDLNLDAGLHIAGEILPRADGFHGSGNGRMYVCGNESARFGYRLSDLDLVPGSHNRLGRSSDMLGYGDIHCRRYRKRLNGAVA